MIGKYKAAILSLVLLVLAGVLIGHYKVRRENLKVAYWHLAGNFWISQYLEDQDSWSQNAYSYEKRKDPALSSIEDAALALAGILDSMNLIIVRFQPNTELSAVKMPQALRYFGDRVSVRQKTGSNLKSAIINYNNAIDAYLRNVIMPMRNHYAVVLAQDTAQFIRIEQRVNSMQPGNFETDFFMNVFKDTVITQKIYARKSSQGIEWRKQEYDDYIAFLGKKLDPTNELMLNNERKLLSNAFIGDDKLMINKKMYDLNDLTIAELSTVYTKIAVDKSKIDKLFLRLSRDIRPL